VACGNTVAFADTLNYPDLLMITTMRGSGIEAMPVTEAQFGLLTPVFLRPIPSTKPDDSGKYLHHR